VIVLNSELSDYQQLLKKWINDEISPHYEQWEKDGIIPREVWLKAGAQGILCSTQDEKFGGLGVDFQFPALLYQELFRAGFAALGVGLAVHSDLVANYLSHFGNEEQKMRWLPKMVSGECIGAIAMTEPGTGSDLAAIQTKAILKNGQWVINGQKTFISNGIHSDLVIVVARTDTIPEKPHAGISLFLVERNTLGFSRGQRLKKLGLHAQDTAELIFEDCTIPEANLLGKRGEGFLYLMKNLGVERLGIAVMSLAQARGAFEVTLKYIQERKAFGKSIASFQNTRFKMAEMLTELDVGEAFLQQCIQKHCKKQDITISASQAKLWASEKGQQIVDTCLQLHGGYGYMDEYVISRFFRDSRVQRIYGGTSEIMKEVISRQLT
jgi:acyl-CoA dehydrogenase